MLCGKYGKVSDFTTFPKSYVPHSLFIIILIIILSPKKLSQKYLFLSNMIKNRSIIGKGKIL